MFIMSIILSLDKFLSYFNENNITFPLSISLTDFEKQLIVSYHEPTTLYEINTFTQKKNGKTVLNSPDDYRFVNRMNILKCLYDIIVTNRILYLSRFFKSYFKMPNPMNLKWNGIDLNVTDKFRKSNEDDTNFYISVQLNDISRRIVRNIFHIELLDKTRIINVVKSDESFWQNLTQTFNDLILQDRFFAKSSLEVIQRRTSNGEFTQSIFYLFQSYLLKASIFNPYSIKWIIENIITPLLPSSKTPRIMMSPVLSWASYLIAFMELSSEWKSYIGIDVIPSVCKKTRHLFRMYKKLSHTRYGNKKVAVICQPSEQVHSTRRLAKFDNKISFVIACFPYFNMEDYIDGEQSIKTYPSYNDWLKNYIKPTMEMSALSLHSHGIFAFITNNYSLLNKEKTYFDLKNDMFEIASSISSLKFLNKYLLVNRTSPLRMVKKDRIETMYIFQKI